ncbi:MAG: sensor histidine kinase [Hyphomicrobium sp.]
MTSFPWGGSACFAQTVSGCGIWIRNLISLDKVTYQRVLHSLAILHLFGIEILTIRSDVLPITLFFSLTGLVLIFLTLSKNYISSYTTPEGNISLSERKNLRNYAHDLLNHSKTFLDITQTTSRQRKEREMEAPVWAELAARMSHDLRTPLNAVIGFSDLMHAETFGPLGNDRYRDYIQHIQDSCRDLLKNTEKTLAFTSSLRKENIETSLNRINLLKKIKEACVYYENEIQKRCIDFQIFIPEGLEILSEENHFQQILINVLGEALKRVHNNQTVEIGTEGTPSGLALTFKVLSPKVVSHYEEPSLELCIVRALLERKGAHLILIDNEELWLTQFMLERADQKNFVSLKSLHR